MKKNIYTFLACLFLCMQAPQAFAQMGGEEGEGDGGPGGLTVTITGDNTVNSGESRNYYASFSGGTVYAGNWSVVGGTITFQSLTTATITWNSSPGTITYNVTASTAGSTLKQYLVTVTALPPPVPSTPSISNNCGSTVLTRGNPPSGITWYWQSTASGTSTGNASASITRTSGSVYYLRAKSSSTGLWSSARTVNYGINAIPGTPSTPTLTNNCGSTELTKGNAPSGITWYWQSSPSGTSTSNASSTIVRTSGNVYYLRARNNSSGCWSSARTVNYNIISTPATPSAPTLTNNCGSTELTKGNAPSGITWYWQSSASGTSTSNASSTIVRTSGSVYYLRARNNSSGCWSSARTANYNIISTPAIPSAPTVTNNCGNTVLTKGSSPSGITWYWQSSASGTSTSNASTNITRTSGTVYYLRARNNSSGCWSSSRTVNYSISTSSTWYADTDGDGFGDPNVSLVQCGQPSGYVSNSNDQCPTVSGSGNGCPSSAVNLTANENYIYTITPQKGVSTISQLTENKDALKSIVYFDGLGRAKQRIAIQQSNTHKDIVNYIEYDSFGRQLKEYLPYAASQSTGGLITDATALSGTNSYYNTHYALDLNTSSPNPYSEKVVETSPLARVYEQTAPGEDWKKGSPISGEDYSNGHTIKFDYGVNGGSEVRQYWVTTNYGDLTYTPSLQGGNVFYAPGTLSKTVTKDENWETSDGVNHTTEEFKNKRGQVLLKRTYASTGSATPEAHDTYYVYDDFGNLTYVFPPKVNTSDGITATELSELSYQYLYDSRNRLVSKKTPGKGWEYIVYDKLDRPVMTQDAMQRATNNSTLSTNQWLFTKYDVHGRVIYTGNAFSNAGRTTIQSALDSQSLLFENNTPSEVTIGLAPIHYSNNVYPTYAHRVLTINYYDTYRGLPTGFTSPTTVYGQVVTTKTQGLATMSKVRVLDTNDWVTTITYYDDKARPIYIYSHNEYLGTTDIVESKLDAFNGRVLETKTTHKKTGKDDVIIVDLFEYDHAGRLLLQKQKINSGTEEVIAHHTYDELGQLISKGVGNPVGSQRAQTVDYKYNIRGWLKSINDTNSSTNAITLNSNDVFGFEINYNTPTDPTKKLYNGNISETLWKTTSVNTTGNPVSNKYIYTYDALNRITSASDNTGNYDVYGIQYDKNGNITDLRRDGKTHPTNNSFGEMDRLDYFYDGGNKLLKVVDAVGTQGFKDGTNSGNDYEYDVNGNIVKDLNKGIGTSSQSGISYNYLNLPTEVKFDNNNNKKISYIYDASGVKLRKVVNDNGNITTTDYAGNFVYENSTLQFFSHAEGYVKASVTSNGIEMSHVYQYKDHLGNVRLSYIDSDHNGSIAQSEIIEESNYYPFGLKHQGYHTVVSSNGNSVAQKKRFNDKESQDELGLNWYDYGWRNHNTDIGRWMNIDPLADKYYLESPYNYTMNNPIFFIDPDGRKVDVTDLVINDTEEDLYLLINLMANLAEISGQAITLNETNEGTWELGIGRCFKNTCKSDSASSYVSNLINDDSSTIEVVNNKRSYFGRIAGSHANPKGKVWLDADQIKNLQNRLSESGIDRRTLNVGMVFLHESLHTKYGASFYDNEEDNKAKKRGIFIDPREKKLKATTAGETVKRVNVFRREMGLPTRENYTKSGTPATISFKTKNGVIEVNVEKKKSK